MKNENKFFLVVTVNKMLFKICGIFDKVSRSVVVNKSGSVTELEDTIIGQIFRQIAT